ncbi:MAG: energy-coupled thiamine transporter ThiT [Eubacteriales bacterium]|nr:energy-coupled thiamine transporter ThiT [Eubacteriales bacterium]
MSIFARYVEADGSYQLTQLGYLAIILVMIALLLAACFITKADKKAQTGTRRLVFSAMAIALALVTSFIKFIHMPMGGSVTLFSMLFICLIGYWYGLRTGLMAAIAYGFLQLIIDPYIISVPQMLVDYIFAFGALGLSGLFSNARHGLIKGYLVGVLGRYFFAFLSGMIFFGSYAADYNMAAPVYSLVYNGAYIGLEALFTLILIAIPAIDKALVRIKTLAMQEA